MARIFSIPEGHSISIPDKFIVRDDECIGFEIPGFFWQRHAEYKCSDCKAFYDSFGKSTYKWLLYHNDQYYFLDLRTFGNDDEHFNNLSQFQISSTFSGTKLKFRRSTVDHKLTEELLRKNLSEERYEACQELQNVLYYLTTDIP